MTAVPDARFRPGETLSTSGTGTDHVRRVHPGEGLTLRLTGTSFVVEAEILELTPGSMTVGVALEQGLPPPEDVLIVEHTGRRTEGIRHEAFVKHVTEFATERGRTLRIELRLISGSQPRAVGQERRSCERFVCPAEFPAMAWAPSPIFFGESVTFRIEDASRQGATLSALSGISGLFPGMELDLRVTLFPLGEFEVRGRVVSIPGVGSKEPRRVGVLWIDAANTFVEALAEHLLQGSAGLTPARLRQGGLEVRKIRRVATYDYVASPEDYEAVLDLQLRAHQHEGRFLDAARDDMASPVDACSRHVTCRVGGRIVGYTRATPVCGDESRSQASLAGHVIPDWLWRAGFVEGHGVAIAPDFQRAGLLVPLVQHFVRIGCESGCDYLLGGCEAGLLPVYQQMGFVEVEKRAITPRPGWSFDSHLLVLDVRQVVRNPGQGKWTREVASAIAFVRDNDRPSSGIVVSGPAISEQATVGSRGGAATGG